MKINILNKIILVLIITGLLPIAVFTFLTIDSYQGLVEKYTPYIEAEHPELVSETKLSYENVKNQTYLIFLLIVTFIIFFSIFLSQKLTYPIKKLIRGTNELGKGNLSVRINVKTKDEFETLANSFNKMAADLEESYSLIEEEKQSLEIKVAARTKELKELAVGLEEKVKGRTKQLQERVDELEEFHRLTIGRETRMMELKKKIKELEEKLEGKNKS